MKTTRSRTVTANVVAVARARASRVASLCIHHQHARAHHRLVDARRARASA